MAGHRRARATTETLVARHRARKAAYERDLQRAGANPSAQVMAAAEYLRGAIARTVQVVPADAAAVGRAAAKHLAGLADDLFRTAIQARRNTR